MKRIETRSWMKDLIHKWYHDPGSLRFASKSSPDILYKITRPYKLIPSRFRVLSNGMAFRVELRKIGKISTLNDNRAYSTGAIRIEFFAIIEFDLFTRGIFFSNKVSRAGRFGAIFCDITSLI
ncbi:hypothetical protein BpHYR1_013651 [Brachionus plicatilis]|uniref:Uncharacterized protein n=1 Tax=Brachionus plicatilis TaxID=10195 RepID=A0A3M7SXB7_BRAPC|nr:hypothetical protein BpHYR1_013651 [Brachionus plicatilis]